MRMFETSYFIIFILLQYYTNGLPLATYEKNIFIALLVRFWIMIMHSVSLIILHRFIKYARENRFSVSINFCE